MISRRRQGVFPGGCAVGLMGVLGLLMGCTPGGGNQRADCPPSRDGAVYGSEGNQQVVMLSGRFAYHDVGGSLWIVGADGTGRKRLTDPPEGAFDFDPD